MRTILARFLLALFVIPILSAALAQDEIPIRQQLIDSRQDKGDGDWAACAYDAIAKEIDGETAEAFALSYIDADRGYVVSEDPSVEAISVVQIAFVLGNHCSQYKSNHPLDDWAPLG